MIDFWKGWHGEAIPQFSEQMYKILDKFNVEL